MLFFLIVAFLQSFCVHTHEQSEHRRPQNSHRRRVEFLANSEIIDLESTSNKPANTITGDETAGSAATNSTTASTTAANETADGRTTVAAMDVIIMEGEIADSAIMDSETANGAAMDTAIMDDAMANNLAANSTTAHNLAANSSTANNSAANSSTVNNSASKSSTMDNSTANSPTANNSAAKSSTTDNSTVNSPTANNSAVNSSTADDSIGYSSKAIEANGDDANTDTANSFHTVSNTCAGKCGLFNGIRAACHCDMECEQANDCCEDYADQCIYNEPCRGDKYSFTCDNMKNCIDERWKCDGQFMCSDGSDEKHCPCTKDYDCKMGGQTCQDGLCVFYNCEHGDSNCLCGNDTENVLYCDQNTACLLDAKGTGKCVDICAKRGTNCLCGNSASSDAIVCTSHEICLWGKKEEPRCDIRLGDDPSSYMHRFDLQNSVAPVGELCDDAIIVVAGVQHITPISPKRQRLLTFKEGPFILKCRNYLDECCATGHKEQTSTEHKIKYKVDPAGVLLVADNNC